MEQMITVNEAVYAVVSLLGKGKGGYSYLVEKDGKQFVLKQIHHEPCAYYTFGNKIEAEQNDYIRLENAGIPIPRMLDIDIPNERILKEYIDGPTAFELVKNDALQQWHLDAVRAMAEKAMAAGLNIDYFPTNFVESNGTLFYVDYECNVYSPEWNFENWGIRYWSKTPEFLDYLRQHTK